MNPEQQVKHEVSENIYAETKIKKSLPLYLSFGLRPVSTGLVFELVFVICLTGSGSSFQLNFGLKAEIIKKKIIINIITEL